MNKLIVGGTAMAALLLSLGVGFFLGRDIQHTELAKQSLTVGTAKPNLAERKVLYWKHPEGDADFSASPKQTSDGRDYVAVYDNEERPIERSIPTAASPLTSAAKDRAILFYRNPMGLPDTSPVPKKDWMGMDYIPVYEGEDENTGTGFKISLDKVQRAGVRTEIVKARSLARPVKAAAVAAYNERSMHAVTLRADAFIEKLFVNETGAHVKKGQPLFRIYSPEMVNAQVDFRIALRDKSSQRQLSLKGARQKLENFEIPEAVLKAIEQSGEPVMAVDWPSPVSGVVLKKNVVDGQMVRMGEEIFMLVGLDKIWVVADVAEQDIGLVVVGQPARVTFKAYPGETFTGQVTFILHELQMTTRSAKVRIELDNTDHRIKHEMFAEIEINTGAGDSPRIAVPNSSIINSGDRQVVLVTRGEGRFEPRAVKLGLRGETYTEIKSGIAEGEEVVVSANFLIDAESNLKAALSAFNTDRDEKKASSASEEARP